MRHYGAAAPPTSKYQGAIYQLAVTFDKEMIFHIIQQNTSGFKLNTTSRPRCESFDSSIILGQATW